MKSVPRLITAAWLMGWLVSAGVPSPVSAEDEPPLRAGAATSNITPRDSVVSNRSTRCFTSRKSSFKLLI